MKTVWISVTEAARNFADCVNRARYQGTTFVFKKNGKAVARLVPEGTKHKTGKDLALALREGLEGARLTRDEADAWIRDLNEARRNDQPPAGKWPS
jgi:antitoxin (DNA-binding transcriptional repressor) of toxin-antitoxin stability system